MLSSSFLIDYLSSTQVPLDLKEFLNLFSENKASYLFIKNKQSQYAYANQAFFTLMGMKNLQQLAGKNDCELYDNKALVKQYIEDDTCVFEEEKKLLLLNEVNPKFNSSLNSVMKGMLYPLAIYSEKPDYVLGIVSPVIKIKQLDWDTIFNLTSTELGQLLIKKSYPIITSWGKFFLSKKELQVLFELLQGYHAGQIGHRLQLKQTTIESYLSNIKNKIGVNSKSEIISFILSSRLFHQVL